MVEMPRESKAEDGPYLEGQWPAECGCYYPDVALHRDNPQKGERILYCIVHGFYSIPLGNVREPLTTPNPLPTEEWLEAERQRIRSQK